ncbi:DEKNAAC104258 [Brettanomyces naardenensis]|uniref:DEKNAAC104258 n=1 Tax=Brettanomyces naardenensis TaxID=13370 RepID=A0A448YQJ2_BRENA|nr:DEKNAAC104258 [Brettanomyces naardenensis]
MSAPSHNTSSHSTSPQKTSSHNKSAHSTLSQLNSSHIVSSSSSASPHGSPPASPTASPTSPQSPLPSISAPVSAVLSSTSLEGLLASSFEDPGVSNGDVDWLFRGREVKKLKKKVKVVNTTAQSQLEEAQKRAKSRRPSLAQLEPVSPKTVSTLKPSLKVVEKPSASAPVPIPLPQSGTASSSVTPASEFTRSRSSSDSKNTPDGGGRRRSFFSSLSSKLLGKPDEPKAEPVPTSSSPSSSFMGIRRRPDKKGGSESEVHPHHSHSTTMKSAASTTSITSTTALDHVHTELNSVPFRRVTFALDKLPDQPQQQIPSRRPRRGNVVTPEDLTAPPSRMAVGIADSVEANRSSKVDPKELKDAKERMRLASAEARRHAEEAHSSAIRLAKEVSKYKKWKKGEKPLPLEENIEPDAFSGHKLDIDTPLHEHVDYFEEEQQEEQPLSLDHNLSLEELYSRCCHLREILAIPVTLKQLRGKSKPLHVLKMLNPRPTMIDVLSFSDFLSIAPIVTVIFDNVTLNTEMLNTVLVSLSRSTTLEKLSLRNMPIDSEGWKCLCKFLTVNRGLSKLDVSQQKIRAEMPKNCNRSVMDWDLFSNCIALRGGIEELVINGCKLSTSHFRKLVDDGLSIGTRRLGVAATGLDIEKSTILSRWISSPSTTCVGVDMAFNDLDENQLIPFNEVFQNKPEAVKLVFFSLNKTNIGLEEAKQTIKNLSLLKDLRFLDLGNDPQLFPDIIPTLKEYLPKFPELRRIHFEFDNLSEVSLIHLSLLFHKCPKLVHVSLLGNNSLSLKSAVALYAAIKSSNIYNLDMDYDLVGDELASKMAYYLMRNMERFLNNDTSIAASNDEDLIFDGRLLARAAEDLLESRESQSEEEMAVIWDSLADRTIRLRQEIHHTIDQLFAQREKGTLSIEGKENLLRLCLLDDSLENILSIFHEETKKYAAAATVAVTAPSTERPGMLRRISSQVPMHEASSDFIFTGPIVSPTQTADDMAKKPTEEESAPHQVVEDMNMKTVDNSTGKPVLLRSASQTSIHGKELEEEEGEFHKWGFFVQQQSNEEKKLNEGEKSSPIDERRAKLKQANIPSGTALREAVIKAKGIESISDLIHKVGDSESPSKTSLVRLSTSEEVGSGVSSASSRKRLSEMVGSENSSDSEGLDELVAKGHAEKVYERLLDNAAREREERATGRSGP